MAQGLLYDVATGQILGAINAPAEVLNLQTPPAGQALLIGEGDPKLHMVVEGQRVDRPVMPVTVSKTTILADDEDEAVISGIVPGTVIRFDGQDHTVVTGEIRFTADVPGTYAIYYRGFPYQHWVVEIEAEEAT